MQNRFLIGVDIGGTKISVALGNNAGRMVEKKVFPTRYRAQAKHSISEIQSAIERILKIHQIHARSLVGIGVGVPGPIDQNRGVIGKSPNLPGWQGVRLPSILKRRFKTRVEMDNDANAAVLGELYFGSGRGVSDFIYVTVSTGIGSGIIAGGKLIRGASGGAGEIGHITVVPNGNPCGCGKSGCLEAYASGTAIAQYVQEALKKGRLSRYFSRYKESEITGRLVSRAAKLGDRLAVQARRQAADFLGIGLANVINLLNPKRVILGGGVMETTHHFWQPMMRAIRREAWPSHLKDCQILRSKLGSDVGNLGAMALVLSRTCACSSVG